MAIPVDHIQRKWVLFDAGDNLNIKLVPALWEEVGAVPVREEGGNCAFLVGCSHASDKLAVAELLVAGDGT